MTDARGEVGRKSVRLSSFDYSSAGWYFITLCTHARRCVLGSVRDSSVLLSRTGIIVRDEWLRSQELRPGLAYDQWVIMPNHLHAIVVLPDADRVGSATRAHSCAPLHRRPRSLSSFVGQFKATVTRRLKQQGLLASRQLWQRGYYDHIIRSQRALEALREYIYYNPLKWELDKYNPQLVPTDGRDEADVIVDTDSRNPLAQGGKPSEEST